MKVLEDFVEIHGKHNERQVSSFWGPGTWVKECLGWLWQEPTLPACVEVTVRADSRMNVTQGIQVELPASSYHGLHLNLLDDRV